MKAPQSIQCGWDETFWMQISICNDGLYLGHVLYAGWYGCKASAKEYLQIFTWLWSDQILMLWLSWFRAERVLVISLLQNYYIMKAISNTIQYPLMFLRTLLERKVIMSLTPSLYPNPYLLRVCYVHNKKHSEQQQAAQHTHWLSFCFMVCTVQDLLRACFCSHMHNYILTMLSSNIFNFSDYAQLHIFPHCSLCTCSMWENRNRAGN